jgi:4-diphosphocytidyl-2-C-methyl-D-erythritol kinase
MLILEAPAKINLTLEVLGKRTDGYHEIRSVIQTLSFCDSLQITPGKEVEFKGNIPEWSSERSLVIKAVESLKKATGSVMGAKIKIKKRIPLISGLGGDSSDAAAILRGLNQFWELNVPPNKLRDMAQNLGSDVSFFLTGGTALMEGRGETITSLPPIPHHWIILIIPDVSRIPGKTKRLYSMLQPAHFTDGKITDKLAADLKLKGEFNTSLLFNTFENVVFARGEELTNYRDHLLKLGAPNVHLAGSGPTLFTILTGKPQAEGLIKRLKDMQIEAYLTETRSSL